MFMWDLKYAPVNIKKSKNSLKNNILIALGGTKEVQILIKY